MAQKIYQVDAFTDQVFKGNPAAVCPLEDWLPDDVMQNIAMENNLAETAFFVKKADLYELRWFTPEVEVDLCGHATLAAAFVLFNHENHGSDEIIFHSPRSGTLKVSKKGELLSMNFPSDTIQEAAISSEILDSFNEQPLAAFEGKTDLMLVYENENQIASLSPDFNELSKLNYRGVICTAPGAGCDFVSRFFAPQVGVNEDPVTGSAHTTLVPYWSAKYGKIELSAKQLSKRTGILTCKFLGERTELCGTAKLYLQGEIFVG